VEDEKGRFGQRKLTEVAFLIFIRVITLLEFREKCWFTSNK